MEIRDAETVSAMRYFNRTAFAGGDVMSRKDASCWLRVR